MVDFSGNSRGLNNSGFKNTGGNNYGSFGARKQSMNTGAGASSESLLVKRMAEQRKRAEREKNKQQLNDLQRKFDHNKIEISRKETDIRRLNTEVAHADRDLEIITADMMALDEKEHDMKVKRSDSSVHVDELERKVILYRKEADEIARRIEHTQNELTALQRELVEQKRQAYEAGLKIQKTQLEIKQDESTESKVELDANRANSEKKRKAIEMENKKRAADMLKLRRDNEAIESKRLKDENTRLETEIHSVEMKLKGFGTN